MDLEQRAMDLAFVLLASLGILAILKTKDNVLAAFSLLVVGLVTAAYAAALGMEPLFVLVALAYIASALVLVIIAAAAVSENGVKTSLKPYAALPLALSALALLPEGPAQPKPLDPQLLLPAAALALFSLLVAARIGRP
jgi:NADH:ubiquinone oxidoreductase subunit 6 (subunit J)